MKHERRCSNVMWWNVRNIWRLFGTEWNVYRRKYSFGWDILFSWNILIVGVFLLSFWICSLSLPSVASSEKMSTCQHLRAWSRLFRIIELDFQYSIHNNNAEWNVGGGGPKVDFSDFHDFSISFTFHVVDTHTTHTANNFCQFSFQLFSRLSSTHRRQ